MLKPPDTVSIAFVHGMLSGVKGEGNAVGAWLDHAGIARHLVDDPAARVTAEQYVALFRVLMDELDDELLHFLSRPLRRGTLALLLRSTLGADDLGHALRRMSRAFNLLQDDLELVLVDEGSSAGFGLAFTDATRAHPPFLHELQLRVFWRLIAWLHGGRLRPARFDFAIAVPAHAAEYAKVFPGTVRFDAPRSMVWFDANSLKAPMLRDDAAVRAFLALAPGIVVMPLRREHATGARVRAYLQATRPAWPDLAATAAALHLSDSTLQRHLAAEGTTFRTIRDALRRDLAITRLQTTALPLSALATELGFADSAAFQRAFKSWMGSAAGSFRRASGVR